MSLFTSECVPLLPSTVTSLIKPRESVTLAAVHARGTVFHRWGGIRAFHSQQTWLACFTQLSVSLYFKPTQHTINHFYNWCSAVIQCQTQLQLIAVIVQSFRNLASEGHMRPRSARAPSGLLVENPVSSLGALFFLFLLNRGIKRVHTKS